MRGFLTFILLLGNYIMMFDGVAAASVSSSPLETYIVHVEPPSQTANAQNELSELERYYLSFMPTASRAGQEVPRIVFSYENVFFGFAATLSEEDVNEMETKPGFIFAEKEEILTLDTTNSPTFLGLSQSFGLWPASQYGRQIIIGVLDTGINPGHRSFNPAGMPVLPRPPRWTGRCEFSHPLSCNNKLIGARSFVGGEPLDRHGHGSHVAGIAAGNFVNGANVNGSALGTAVGIAPRAFLAVYKVCDDRGSCPESALLAGMDYAISDGVDVISVSLGGRSRPFHRSNSAIGAFAAMERGIFVSCSGGNSGPALETMSNEAPWVLTVGASTTDRKIRSVVRLGNHKLFEGQSAASFPSISDSPLVYPGRSPSDPNQRYCGSRFSTIIQNRIVICLTGGGISRIQKGRNVRNAGGIAMILVNEEELGYETWADLHVLPTSHVSYADGREIFDYERSSSPRASVIFIGTVLRDDPHAPMVASFSSRGPNQESNGILKPDILGPGVEILSASHRIADAFAMNSGTSMSCPHLSGVAALLKASFHMRSWSPAAIKSAIMTTADIQNRGNNLIANHFHDPATVLATGSGQVNPSRALNPGLIYDITPDEYVPYLCGLGYTRQQVETIVRRREDCRMVIPQTQLNYPSFSLVFGPRTQTYTRTLTNVGNAISTYRVSFNPGGLEITVNPTTLEFTSLNQRISYHVTFRLPTSLYRGFTNDTVHGVSLTNKDYVLYQGSITWTSGQFSVRSPISAIVYQNAALSNLETVPLLDS